MRSSASAARDLLGSAMPQRALMPASVLGLGRVLPLCRDGPNLTLAVASANEWTSRKFGWLSSRQSSAHDGRWSTSCTDGGVLEWTTGSTHAAGLTRPPRAATAAEG